MGAASSSPGIQPVENYVGAAPHIAAAAQVQLEAAQLQHNSPPVGNYASIAVGARKISDSAVLCCLAQAQEKPSCFTGWI